MTNNKILLLLLPLLALACVFTTPIEAKTAETFPTQPTSPTQALPPTESPQMCEVTAEALHLRAMPGTHAEVIGYLYAGDLLTILPDPPAGAWLRVRAGALTGWINSHYCTKGK